jgi:hypothetical protein
MYGKISRLSEINQTNADSNKNKGKSQELTEIHFILLAIIKTKVRLGPEQRDQAQDQTQALPVVSQNDYSRRIL